MATAVIDGIQTRYEVLGDGPPILMFSPGGFDATLDKWSTQSVYARIKLLDHLPKKYTCIVFDRRETGQSGGRVERLTWEHYARQGQELLAHLGFSRAHVIGACMGCSVAAAFASTGPQLVDRLVLYWPVGGANYRIQGHARFDEHAAYVRQHGLAGVVALARESDKPFGGDPRGGPWVSVLRRDRAF
ncbi:MAG: alpha/beta hydrolase, partial [Acidobacteria bacterium]